MSVITNADTLSFPGATITTSNGQAEVVIESLYGSNNTSNTIPTLPTHIMTFANTGWVQLQNTVSVTSNTTTIDFTLPDGFKQFKIVFGDYQGTNSLAGQLSLRFANNANGANVFVGATDYGFDTYVITPVASTIAYGTGSNTYIQLTSISRSNTVGHMGEINFTPGISNVQRAQVFTWSVGHSATPQRLFRHLSGELVAFTNQVPVKLVRLFALSSDISRGDFTLFGLK